MLKWFKPRHQALLGIDISATSVKIVEFSGEGENRSLINYGFEALPANTIEGHLIKDVDAVADCIRKLVASKEFKAKLAAVAVRDSGIISKMVQVNDGLDESETEQMIMMDADKYIPFPIEEINLDFVVQGPSAKNPSKLDVLIVASRSENVNSRVEAIAKAGLQIKFVDVESFAIERAVMLLANDLPAQGQEKTVAVLDIGTTQSCLCVLQNLKMIYTREEDFGEEQLVKDIAQHYGLSSDVASKKLGENDLPDDYRTAVEEPFVETLLLQIKRSIQIFFSSAHLDRLDHIVLAGNLALLPNLCNLVQDTLKTPTTIANPLKSMAAPKDVSEQNMQADGASLMIACGLAMRQCE